MNRPARARSRRRPWQAASRASRSTATTPSPCAKSWNRALARARAGDGPTVVEALTYRLSDHTTADDATRYRPAGELEAAWQREPLARLRTLLEKRGAWDPAHEAQLKSECAKQIDAAVQAYFAHPRPACDSMFEHLFANAPAAAAGAARDRAALRAVARPGRSLAMAKVTLVDAINMALASEMARDPDVVLIGEDIGTNGGVFRATAGLQQRFGKDRVQDTPLAEGVIAGMAVGMAAQG